MGSAHPGEAGPVTGPASRPSETASGSTEAFPAPPELSPDTEVWLIRHGETQWSRDGRHTGRTDVDLTDHGVEQARALIPLLSGMSPALVLSSPRLRARRTAELSGLRVDDIDDDLAEWDYGDYEGLTTPQIRRDHPRWTIWTAPAPGGETAAQVGARADRVLERVRAGVPRGTVVLFGHGHINRVLAARWIGLSVADGGAFALGTAAPCVLGAEHSRPVVVRWNIANPAIQ